MTGGSGDSQLIDWGEEKKVHIVFTTGLIDWVVGPSMILLCVFHCNCSHRLHRTLRECQIMHMPGPARIVHAEKKRNEFEASR